ncbi:MAG: hypothetical protein LH473_05465, partial [Chitinophagales bacterium]|nr:hypothetical protein [Chitinophagales bacterium]
MLRYCIAVLFSFCPLNVHAQYLYMKHFTAANGLPSNTVNDVLQDDDGFIWFATDNGVSKFDGHHFTNFTTKDGIADNEVIRLGKDHQSRMWFLGFNGKSSFYLKGKFYNENNSRVAAQTQLSSVFSKFLISKTKTIYLISNTDGFIQVNGDSVKKFSKELLRKQFGIGYINGYKTVKLDADNNLWIFSGDSALIFNKGNLTTQPPEHRQVSSKMVLSHFLSEGSYVEPSLGKLIRYTGNKKDSITNLPGNSMFDYVDLEEDGNNNLWLMTKSGAYIFRDKKFDEQHQKKILDGKYCGHVFTDNQFNTWLTPLRDGVYLIPSLDIQFISTQDGLSNNNVLVITDRPQGAIIGFANGSAQFIQVQNHSLLLQQPFAIGSYMLDILPAKNHQLLFLTNAEVITTDDHFNILKRKIVNWAKSYTQLQDGSLLIGGGFLLSSLKNEKITLLFKFNNENRIYCIAEDEQKIIWLGTEEGLYSFHDSIMQFQGEKFSLVKGRINDLKFDDRGRLWIASSQNGLLLKDKNDIRSMLDTGENISVRKIFLGHDKNIYAGSDKGIFILTENGNRNCKITHIKKSDGLASEKINTLLVKDSMIWVGTDEGLQIFQLNKKLQQLSSIPIRLTQFTVNGKTFSGDSTLNLSYRQNNIHVSFIGINFREPQSVTYRYRFESAHDSIWKYTNNSS